MTPPLRQKSEKQKSVLMKEESEKVGLKLNTQKTEIMASDPITSWQIDGETVETVADFIFWAPKLLQMVTAAMKLKDAYSLEGKLWPTLMLLLQLSLQSGLTLCNPTDSSPLGSAISGILRQEQWSGLPFPTPMPDSEKWKWSRSVMSNSSWPHGLQPTRLPCSWYFPGKSTGLGCHAFPMTNLDSILKSRHITLSQRSV